MKTVGIIVEYNPLHNGHVYHFQQSKIVSEADAVVAVMSGSFLQRGEPALVNKWARTEMALAMGADLVIELPVAFSTQPAEWFAFGAVSALEATGVVDAFCFGSESGDLERLQSTARRLHAEDRSNLPKNLTDDGSEDADSGSFRDKIRSGLKAGASYPSAYAAAAGSLLEEGDREWLAQPNNTLGLHYLLALERLQGRMRPFTIRRHKAGYNQADISDERIASATALRKLLEEETAADSLRPFVPEYTWSILRRELAAGRAPVSWESFFRTLFARIAVTGTAELSKFGEVTEGLEHRIKRAIGTVNPDGGRPFEQLMGAMKTKRYTRTKLQRTMTRILLNHSKDALPIGLLSRGVPYLRILGFSPRGQMLLKAMRKTAAVPVVTRTASCRHPLLDLDIQAAAIHALAYRSPSHQDLSRDYSQPPLRLGDEREQGD